jgi:hypothetical protein
VLLRLSFWGMWSVEKVLKWTLLRLLLSLRGLLRSQLQMCVHSWVLLTTIADLFEGLVALLLPYRI